MHIILNFIAGQYCGAFYCADSHDYDSADVADWKDATLSHVWCYNVRLVGECALVRGSRGGFFPVLLLTVESDSNRIQFVVESKVRSVLWNVQNDGEFEVRLLSDGLIRQFPEGFRKIFN